MKTPDIIQKAQSRVSRMLHSVVLHFSPCEWRSIDDLPPRGNEYDEYDERCIVVWQDAEHETDQGVEVTCLAHIRDGDFHQGRYLNPVWRTVMDAPIYTQNAEVSFRACEINSTDMFGVSVARVDGFRSQPTVNTDEDMVRVVLDMPKGTWRKLKSIIPPNDNMSGGR